MKHPKKAAIVGAGGIGCHLAPLLSREMDIVLIDADNYEPHNSTRQFPALKNTGNKAKVLMEMIQPNTLKKVEHLPIFLKDNLVTARDEWEGVDIIFGAVDNNASRRIITELAMDLEIPAILAGNEHEHGEAHMVVHELYNPLEHFDFLETEPVPWGCNTDSVIDEFPQTPLANFLAAGCAMHLLLSWRKVSNPLNAVVYSRTDALSSTFSRAKDMLSKPCVD